ncbi:BnaC05g03950D [Brassica napus]|uniref:BnaC05g03950D protein n=1 Tax=Brassica napus TaxID=3708 RepID=A0A078FAU2_BRANA|nr:BnaC05g03950D [Brassica napus]
MLAAGFEITELDQELPGHKLSNSGPNMLIFWDVLAPNKLEIWFAEVSLERHKETCQIRGNILWSQPIMTLDPPPPHQLHYHKLPHMSRIASMANQSDRKALTSLSSKTASTMETESKSDF